MHQVLGVIPARLESTRLPGKPLREICGRPMIAWVYENARQAACLDHLLVATDSPEVEAYCRKHGIPSMMTSRDHKSGTDRLAEVMAHERASIYVNIQGDEPMITSDHLECLLRPFAAAPETQVSTLKVAIDAETALDPNVVKVVTDLTGRALYFSRARIPFERDSQGQAQYYKHQGLYAYRAIALELFCRLSPSPLEKLEKLEQLRFLENGIEIAVEETPHDTIGVDTEEDLRRVEEYFHRRRPSPER
ncbi:MAG TPA: 3-deoxy-manno-octulosonate cytidylyltransferase [Terriglobia bacterium]|nr:3-deoxy-manno-octulosonate cytidylyltransferase [Terriglobia bacterium]